MEHLSNRIPPFDDTSESFDDINHLNLTFAKRIDFLGKENSIFKSALDVLKTVQNQRDFYREKFVSLDHDFVALKLSKMESDDMVLFLEKELEDLKNSMVCVCAKEDKNILVNEFVARE